MQEQAAARHTVDQLRRWLAMPFSGVFAALAFMLASSTPVLANDNSNAFFHSLEKLCGARFEGAMTFPTSGQDDFAGKLLVADIKSCTSSEIRISFAVGDDTSRTWIISRTAGGLQLQHDHRHPDGTEDAVSMYGGEANAEGTASMQSFAADAHTRKLIPEAATNIWTIRLGDEGNTITYDLQRNGKPRFRAELKRVDSVLPDPGN